MKKDMVNAPPHYNHGSIQPIDFIEDHKLGFNDGNALKYIARHKHKGTDFQVLEKAIWYLKREVERIKKENINENN